MSTTTPLPLAGKSALVTGAARSIGAEIALTLARRSANVVVPYQVTALTRAGGGVGVGALTGLADSSWPVEQTASLGQRRPMFGNISFVVLEDSRPHES